MAQTRQKTRQIEKLNLLKFGYRITSRATVRRRALFDAVCWVGIDPVTEKIAKFVNAHPRSLKFEEDLRFLRNLKTFL